MIKPTKYTNKVFPEYAFIPGKYPHPRSHPEGHSYNKPEVETLPLIPDEWQKSSEYLYGIDLFNYGFYWEAHEAWESVWKANGKEGITADFLKALIRMTAASVKILQRQPKGVKDHSLAAKNIFENIKEKNNSNFFCGLNLDELINFTEFLNNNSDGFKVNGNINPEVLFEYFLSVNNSFK